MYRTIAALMLLLTSLMSFSLAQAAIPSGTYTRSTLTAPNMFPRAGVAQVSTQSIADIGLKFPFRPGSEWQITAGWERAPNHQQNWDWYAIDFVPVGRSCQGEPIIAAAHGWIRNVAYRTPRHEIEIDHGINNYRTLYVHLDTMTAFREGQEVFYGTQVGTCGTYSAQAAHLHFQLFQGPTWDATDGIIPAPIDGVTDPNRLKSNNRGFYSTNGLNTRRLTSASWYLRNSNSSGGANVSFLYGNPSDIPIVGDWDWHSPLLPIDTPGIGR